MADIVLGIGTSHSPLLNSPAEDYPKHAEIDAKGRKLLDKTGQPCTYGDLLAQADPAIKDQIAPDVLAARAARCTDNIARVAKEIEAAALDALIVIGDDQNEQFFDDNMPAILIYWGETIENNPLRMDEDAPAFWRKARSQYHEEEGPREYPVASSLALSLIKGLVARDFDVSHSKRLGREHGEGHAFGFVHRRLMPNRVTPIVPVALNTYFPPNQPRPKRCYDLGRAIAEAVRAGGGGARRHSRLGGAVAFHRRRGARPRPARRLREERRRRARGDPGGEAQFRLVGDPQLAHRRRRLHASAHRLAGVHPVLSLGRRHRLRHGLRGVEVTGGRVRHSGARALRARTRMPRCKRWTAAGFRIAPVGASGMTDAAVSRPCETCINKAHVERPNSRRETLRDLRQAAGAAVPPVLFAPLRRRRPQSLVQGHLCRAGGRGGGRTGRGRARRPGGTVSREVVSAEINVTAERRLATRMVGMLRSRPARDAGQCGKGDRRAGSVGGPALSKGLFGLGKEARSGRREASWTGRNRASITARASRKALPPGRAGAQVAQLVEHVTENHGVGGSIPPLGTI